MTKLFSLLKRGRVWYVRYKKTDNTYSTARTTKKTNRYEAECFAIEYLQKGNIVTKENITLEEYSENFFKWKYQ